MTIVGGVVQTRVFHRVTRHLVTSVQEWEGWDVSGMGCGGGERV